MAVGRPSKYDPEQHPRLARELTGNGKTQAEMAELFGVCRATIETWQVEHPEFLVAVKLGREDATDRVERALFERATGYEHPGEKIVVVSGGQGMGSSVERLDTIERFPPDTAAIKLWLTNRRQVAWRDRTQVEHSGTLTLAEIVGGMPQPPPPAEEAPKPDA